MHLSTSTTPAVHRGKQTKAVNDKQRLRDLAGAEVLESAGVDSDPAFQPYGTQLRDAALLTAQQTTLLHTTHV